MKVICITGAPGTGKTTLSKNLAKMLNFLYLDVNKLISKHKLFEGYDKKRKTKIVDAGNLARFLIRKIKSYKNQSLKGIIIDSHLSHYIPKNHVDLCIVAKCDIKELGRRLKTRGYSEIKIKENIQAEIFDICREEALERRHKILVIDSAKKIGYGRLSSRLLK